VNFTLLARKEAIVYALQMRGSQVPVRRLRSSRNASFFPIFCFDPAFRTQINRKQEIWF
jgi:hypothetical protein